MTVDKPSPAQEANTMQSEIPEDVMKAARKCAGEWNLIDAIGRAIIAERERSRQLLSEAQKEARTKALEDAAMWHDAKVQEYTDKIAVNDAYLARGGRLSHGSRANEYCDDMRSCHRRAAAAIRALQSEER